MQIRPEFEPKSLDDCAHGHLVRPMGHYWRNDFAIVAGLTGEEGTALVFFSEAAPSFDVLGHPESIHVLDFGTDYILEVDHFGLCDPMPEKMFQAPGCLTRYPETWRLNLSDTTRDVAFSRVQFDFETKCIDKLSQNLNNMTTFGAWKLSLGRLDARREDLIPIYSFEHQTRSK